MMLLMQIWNKQPGTYFGISTKSAAGTWKDHLFHRGEVDKIKQFILNNKDKDLYMTPHGFSKPKRLKKYAVDPCLLYSDLDEVDPRKIKIRPTIAIETSPGRFVGYWETDKPASEDINRRLTYMLGADKGGWDRTQVLRIPNTRNYKYDSAPRVKVLWTNGPKYKIADLERTIPVISNESVEDSDEAARVYKKYEDKLDRLTRTELMNGKPKEGKRSEVLWKLNNKCLEVGMTRDEAFTVLWASPWNKFRNRRNGVDQMWKELDKAVDKHFNGFAVDHHEENWNPIPGPISEVEAEDIEWLIPGLIPRRELTILEGDPGLGKSYLIQMISARLCDGKPLPVFPEYHPQGPVRVVHFDTENTAATVTKSRLMSNRCKNLENFFQSEEPFSIDDKERWEVVVNRLEEIKPALVVFDTINTYIGTADTYRSSETQQAMAFFKSLAVRFNCAVVVLRHLTKGKGDKAIYRGQGSIAFAGSARIVATVGQHPEEEDLRVVACTKNNISTKFKSFTFSIEPVGNKSRFVWGESVDYNSEDLMVAVKPNGSDKEKAIEFLKEVLSNGREDASKIIQMAEARSISRSTVNRAAAAIGVNKDITGFGKNRQSWWSI
jgi:archaellum biogenesis ATPase FlaH